MKISVRIFFILFFLLGMGFSVSAQSRREYIEKYNGLAIKKMIRDGIPASITLAQAIIESGGGTSSLAKSTNNHFGIKCHGWKGECVRWYDDSPNDYFRKYETVEESYEDHSVFLQENPRYSVLFSYEKTDYESWAYGLQECGYATNPNYANILINCIENYELNIYDYKSLPSEKAKAKISFPEERGLRPTYITHGLLYVEAEADDSFDKIAYDMRFKVKDLLRYNEVPENFPLRKGDIVYLEIKKKKADKPYSKYVVKAGDSMHRISQRYGIRLENLYKMNRKNPNYVPTEGDVLKLR